MSTRMLQLRFSSSTVFSAAIALRIGLFFYGLLQDAYSPMKYTDIDYFVFTDAAQFVSRGRSPYDRETYRYTPLLAWLLLPCTWYRWSFHFGKVVFAVGDIIAGWLIVRLLRFDSRMSEERALSFASLWLLNPMVATISTRGSSEGLLGVIVVSLLWATVRKRIVLAGILLGLAVHFKIYPFIYGVSIVWWLDETRLAGTSGTKSAGGPGWWDMLLDFLSPARLVFALTSLATFLILSGTMYIMYVTIRTSSSETIKTDHPCRYGWPYLQHSYFHHFTRLDHRHNFSVYNTLLHLTSSPAGGDSLHFESLAFVPQLLLSALIIPIALAKKDLASAMLAQTFAFVTFNKVCTSQVRTSCTTWFWSRYLS